MPDSSLIALFLVGLLGGTHCVGMCGGIVGALSMGGQHRWSLQLAYNAGRITSYVLAGLLAGGLGALSLGLSGQLPVRMALFLLANLMLIAMGLYLLGVTQILMPVERFGHRLWQHLQPLSGRFLPARRASQAFPLGMLWGWLPCGLVYSALTSALSTGRPEQGGALMLAFGLGTLPNLLLAGYFAGRLNRWMRHSVLRAGAGLLVLGFGVHGLYALWQS